jgi:hypothetical protein
MLSVHLIDRYFRSGRNEQLLAGVLANGLEAPLPLRARLGQSRAAAVALGLRRVLELTYGPTALSLDMMQALLADQGEDGSFDGDPVVTAAAVAALGRLLEQQSAPWQSPVGDTQDLTSARDRALAALAGMQATSMTGSDDECPAFRGTDDRHCRDVSQTAAFILVLLANDAAFRAAVRFADLMSWFDEHRESLDTDTQRLWRLARAGLSRRALRHAAAA